MRRTPPSPAHGTHVAYGAHGSTAWQWTPQGVSLVRAPQAPRPVRLPTHTDVIELDVLRSALVVVDMQTPKAGLPRRA
jgi:hypothetical protein